MYRLVNEMTGLIADSEGGETPGGGTGGRAEELVGPPGISIDASAASRSASIARELRMSA